MNYIKKFTVIFTRLFQYFVIFCVSMIGIKFLHKTILLKIDNFNKISDYKNYLESFINQKINLKYHKQDTYMCYEDTGGNIVDESRYCNIYIFYDRISKKKIYVVENDYDGFNYYDEDALPEDIIEK